jgi:AraC-like DNA-binding protein
MKRLPRPELRPFIGDLWISRRGEGDAGYERNLPNGEMHLVFRVTDSPVRLVGADGRHAEYGTAVVGGARSSWYVRGISPCAVSVGAQLRPGASRVLLGVPAHELAERHARLDDFWGHSAVEARDRIGAAATPERMLDALEAILAERLPRVRALHPAVALALDRLGSHDRIEAMVEASGYSHRRFIELFEQSVGLTPKRYARVRRFERALRDWNARPGSAWVEVALAAGFSDQSHFAREFLAFSGVTPEQYRRASPRGIHHVAAVNFLQDPRRGGR